MSFDDLLGRRAALTIRRLASPGAYLAIDDQTDVLLIGSEIPAGAQLGDTVDVFVHLDSAGRAIATTRASKIEMGQVAFLEVTALTPIGAFVDWGLAKELLVPFAEQTAEMRRGARHAIGLYRDTTGRLAGTMRVVEMLDREKVEWHGDEWVEGEAWRNDPHIGLFVILERAWVGLLPKSEPHALSRGQAARFRITNVLPDGKVELSLRGHAHEELANDARRILLILASSDGPSIGDRSSPEAIREVFGLSKKAFKRAVGRLLRDGSVRIDECGFIKAK
jgi:predicted RNA-binding protein (virulence factor B family)